MRTALSMPCQTDLYFPPRYAEYEAQFIPMVRLVPIQSIWGHLAGLGINAADNAFIDATIKGLLKSGSASSPGDRSCRGAGGPFASAPLLRRLHPHDRGVWIAEIARPIEVQDCRGQHMGQLPALAVR